MTITWTEAKTPKTVSAFRAQLLAALDAAGAPTAGWSARAPQRVVVDDFSARQAEQSAITAALAAMLDLGALAAQDDDWTDVFLTFFDEVRIPALSAVWDVPMTSSSLPVTINPGTSIVLQSTGAVIFELAPAAATPLPAPLRFAARTPGTSGNVVASTLTNAKIQTGPAGLSINDVPTKVTAGRDKESNAAAIKRALAKWARLGAGWTRDAFDYLIPLAAPTVTVWTVDDSNPRGPGTTLVLLGSSGSPSTGDEIAAVLALLGSRSVRPLGSGPVYVEAPTGIAYVITANIAGDGTNANLAADAAAALDAIGKALPIGPYLFLETLVTTALTGAKLGPTVAIPTNMTEWVEVELTLPGFGGVRGINSLSSTADAAPADWMGGGSPPANADEIPAGKMLVITSSVTVS